MDAVLGWASSTYRLDHVHWVGEGMGATSFLLSDLGGAVRSAVLLEPDESIGEVLDRRVSGFFGLKMEPAFAPVLALAERWLGCRWENVSALQALREQNGRGYLFVFTGNAAMTAPPEARPWTEGAGPHARLLVHTGPAVGLRNLAADRNLREGFITYLQN